jgi:hypothetical protein
MALKMLDWDVCTMTMLYVDFQESFVSIELPYFLQLKLNAVY